MSRYFVPTVVATALTAFLVWFVAGLAGAVPSSWSGSDSTFSFAFQFGIATLVVACPCALGLATPTAVMVATGVGAQHGLLIKGGEPLENTQRATAVVFDKTGTLTHGQMRVTDCSMVMEQKQLAMEVTPSTRCCNAAMV